MNVSYNTFCDILILIRLANILCVCLYLGGLLQVVEFFVFVGELSILIILVYCFYCIPHMIKLIILH